MDKIIVNGLSKRYGETVAVNDLSFHVGGGEILGLVGHNGAGKTTTLQTLAGITRPSHGEVLIDGYDIAKQPLRAKRCLGYIPDNPRLFEGLTVWEHLAFTAATYRIRDYRDQAEALLDRFDLREKRNELAQNLSRGMRQKVAVVCAYLHQPSVLLFDEPLTGLDPKGIRVLTESIREFANLGAAVVVSSHLLRLVEDLCTDLLALDRGSRTAFGRLSSVLAPSADGGSARLEDVFFAMTNSSQQAESA